MLASRLVVRTSSTARAGFRAASTCVGRTAVVVAMRALRPNPLASPAPLRLPLATRSLSLSSKGAGVIEITDETEYDQALASKGLCVVYFTASWYSAATHSHAHSPRSLAASLHRCGPCQKIKPIYDQLAEDFPEATFLKVDVDECAEIAAAAEVLWVSPLSASHSCMVSRGDRTDRLSGTTTLLRRPGPPTRRRCAPCPPFGSCGTASSLALASVEHAARQGSSRVAPGASPAPEEASF